MSAVHWYRFQVPLLADVQRKGTVPPKEKIKRNPEAAEKTKTTGNPRSATMSDQFTLKIEIDNRWFLL